MTGGHRDVQGELIWPICLPSDRSVGARLELISLIPGGEDKTDRFLLRKGGPMKKRFDVLFSRRRRSFGFVTFFVLRGRVWLVSK